MHVKESEQKAMARAFSQISTAILVDRIAYKGIKFITHNLVVKGTLVRFNGRPPRRTARINEIRFTVGAPNYEEVEILKKNKGILPKSVIYRHYK